MDDNAAECIGEGGTCRLNRIAVSLHFQLQGQWSSQVVTSQNISSHQKMSECWKLCCESLQRGNKPKDTYKKLQWHRNDIYDVSKFNMNSFYPFTVLCKSLDPPFVSLCFVREMEMRAYRRWFVCYHKADRKVGWKQLIEHLAEKHYCDRDSRSGKTTCRNKWKK